MTTTIHQWPTDEDIRVLARNEKIPLFAEAYEIETAGDRAARQA
jgi:hypothetical protein